MVLDEKQRYCFLYYHKSICHDLCGFVDFTLTCGGLSETYFLLNSGAAMR